MKVFQAQFRGLDFGTDFCGPYALVVLGAVKATACSKYPADES